MEVGREISNLVFGGGGTKGCAFPGVMEVVEAQVPRAKIIRCAGTSIGAIYATLFCYGYTNTEITKLLSQKKLSDFISGLSEFGEKTFMQGLEKVNNGQTFFAAKTFKTAKPELKSNLKENLGISNSAAMMHWLTEEGFKALDIKNVTFGDLAAKHKENPEKYKLLYVVTTNISTGRIIVLSHENAPNVLIASATCASAAFPGAFQPVHLSLRADNGTVSKDEHGHQFLDGGLVWNCALTLFDQARFLPGNAHDDQTPVVNNHTLAMRYVDASQNDYYNFNRDIPVVEIDNLIELTSRIVLATFIQQETAADIPINCARTIQIDNLGISTFEVQLSGRKLNALVESGKVSAQQFFNLITQDEAQQNILSLRNVVKEVREEDRQGSCTIQ